MNHKPSPLVQMRRGIPIFRTSRFLTLAVCLIMLTTLLLPVTPATVGTSHAADCIANPFGQTALYLRGAFNGWGVSSDYQFVYNCNRFELLAQLSGPSQFKIADANWSAQTDFGGGSQGNQVVANQPLQLALRGSNLNFVFEGVHFFVLDVSQSSTQPTLTVFSNCRENPLGDTLLGLSGTFNAFSPSGDDYFLYSCDAYYLNVDITGTHEFKIGDPIGTPAEKFGAADSDNNVVVTDTPFPLTSDAEAGGNAANLEATFTGEHTLRIEFDENDRPVLTIGERSWVNPGIAPPITNPIARQVRYDSQSTGYKQPYGAVPASTSVDFTLEAPVGATAVTLVIETRRLEGNQEILQYLNPVSVPMSRTQVGQTDRWQATYQFDAVNVYGYYFELTIDNVQYVYQNNSATIYWTLERGSGGVGEIVFRPANTNDIRRYRQTVYSPDYEVPEYAPDIVYYYIFPERFRNGNPVNDPLPGRETYLNGPIEFHTNWLSTPYVPGNADGSTTDDQVWNNDFFGGDLAGIIEKLDYLEDLGINTLYINPIFEAGSNHKYDAGDYMRVDDNFGTNEEFEILTAEAEARGIRVILDTSLNHTGTDSLYFDRYNRYPTLGAFDGQIIQNTSQWYDWYTFRPNQSNVNNRYVSWLGITTLPELTETDSFKDFAYRNSDSVMKYWLDLGADGWRMDVTPWVSDSFWREWRTEIKTHTPDALLVAETWFDSSKYFLGDMFDSTMNYIFRNTLFEFADGAAADQVYRNIEMMREAYPPQAFYALMNLLSTHDAERALYQFGYTGPSSTPAQIAEAKQRLRLAVLFQMTFPGAPTVFYGDEVGLTGGADPFNRATYPWADKGGQPDEALLEDFKTLIALRNNNAILRRGTIEAPLYIDDHVIVLRRTYGEENAITAFNNHTDAVVVTIDLPSNDHTAVYTDALTGEAFAPIDGQLSVTIPALFGRVLLAEPLYPIGLNASVLVGVQPGDVLQNILNGGGPGHFGWLNWTGQGGNGVLEASLIPPGTSDQYNNPNDPSDTTVSVGDWVRGLPGVGNSNGVRDALDDLIGVEIAVPIWSESTGNGNNVLYLVSGFARVRILSYDLLGQNRITAEYLGTAVYGDGVQP